MKFLESLKGQLSSKSIAKQKMQNLKGGDDKRKGVSGGAGVGAGTNGNNLRN